MVTGLGRRWAGRESTVALLLLLLLLLLLEMVVTKFSSACDVNCQDRVKEWHKTQYIDVIDYKRLTMHCE